MIASENSPRRMSLATLCICAALALSGCINEGNVPDQHPITFEKPKPAGGPSPAQARQALQNWLVANVPDGSSVKDISIGPIRYAQLFVPFGFETDYFACARYTAKNQFGTYTPPRDVIFGMRVYEASKGWEVMYHKTAENENYRQYCIGQPHG